MGENSNKAMMNDERSTVNVSDSALSPGTPYSKYLGNREPLEAIQASTARIRSLAAAWAPAYYERTYAPGKWTARQILIHLAHAELALGNRARMALTTPDYVAQSFDQDLWMAREGTVSGAEAVHAFLALAGMNLAFFRSLSAHDRHTMMSHPEYGAISVDWIIHTIAGHQINHLLQLEQISREL